MNPDEIKRLRTKLGLHQPEFGAMLGLDGPRENVARTVRRWESGDFIPTGPVTRLMLLIRDVPGAASAALDAAAAQGGDRP